MSLLTFAQVFEDCRLAGLRPDHDPKDPQRFYALCPTCNGQIAVVDKGDGYELACSNDCDRSRINDAITTRRMKAPDVAGEQPRERRFIRGGEFVLDAPDTIPAAWGSGEDVLHAQGEPLLICGPPGVGKTTLAQRLVLHRLGVHTGPLLGFPVTVDERPVLYVAADRPEQARRSLRRMVQPQHRPLLDARLLAWRGPLPFNLVSDPSRLAEWAAEQGAGMIVIDSLKDVAVGLADDQVGAAVNQAIQYVVAAGIELVALHHQRKGQDGRKPRTLEDVYGSTWITAGAGSVLLLWGSAGDAYVELLHLKQPAGEIGPLTLHHDHHEGRVTADSIDLLDLAARPDGVKVNEAAALMFDVSDPGRNLVEKARRRLDALARDGKLTASKDGPKDPTTYRLAPFPGEGTVIERDRAVISTRSDHGNSRFGSTPNHAAITADHATPSDPPPLRSRGGSRGRDHDDEARAERLLNDHADLSTEAA